MRRLLEALGASVAFIAGWGSCAWACSRRVDCPKYRGEQLQKWQRCEEQLLRDRHPTPPEGGAA